MKKFILSNILLAFLTCSATASGYEPDYYGKRAEWLRKAEEAKPELSSKTYRPLYLVQPVEDETAYQEWRIEKTDELSSYIGTNMREVPDVMLDFGRHMTGYFTFRIKTLRATQDAPIRIRFTFGEVPAEMATPFDPFPGSLSRAWMQDEVMTIEEVDREITIPRRISGRYMRIELLGDSVGFDYAMEDICFKALSSTDQLMVEYMRMVLSEITDYGWETSTWSHLQTDTHSGTLTSQRDVSIFLQPLLQKTEPSFQIFMRILCLILR